ncbi:MAG: class I SAM-dependent methyltransferase [Flavisolibacter sp.]
MLQNTFERIVPDQMLHNEVTGRETLFLHLERYHYAAKYLVPGTVADIACGVGYGSYLLITEYGEYISKIISVDIDSVSIEYARKKYPHSKIEFVVSDAEQLNSPVPLNNIISLETIEHLPHPQKFIEYMAKQLLPGGRFIASVPITPSMDANCYHLHDFNINTFKNMFLETGLKEVNSFIQVQRYRPFAMLSKKESRSKDLRKNLLGYYLRHPHKLWLRLRSLITDGFANKYLVAVFERSTG